MHNRRQVYLWFLGIAAAILLTIAYFRTGKTAARPETGKLIVASTIYPLYDIARNVTGDEGTVKVIVPPGVSPHLFEFSPRQLEALQDVKAVFAIGHELDNWVTQITNVTQDAQVLIVDQGIRLRTFQDGTTDPHYWLNFANARQITDNIANALVEMDPGHGEAYREHAIAYKKRLTAEEQELEKLLAPVRGEPILTFHDAWFYFAENLGLKIVGTFQPSAGEEPTPRYLAKLQERIAADHIHIIFIEPQLSPDILESFAKDNKVGIAELDPLGGTPGRATYLELMAFNANSVRNAFEKRGP
jgi:zinc transport system substrate-binding protein